MASLTWYHPLPSLPHPLPSLPHPLPSLPPPPLSTSPPHPLYLTPSPLYLTHPLSSPTWNQAPFYLVIPLPPMHRQPPRHWA